jgi:hypothetical protein
MTQIEIDGGFLVDENSIEELFKNVSNIDVELHLNYISSQSVFDQVKNYIEKNNITVTLFVGRYCSNNILNIDISQCEEVDLLYCSFQTITTTELTKCKIFRCGSNLLTKLPKLPKCKELMCYQNQLTKLPKLPECKILKCYSNQLTSLPDLPKCKVVECFINNLTSIGSLPKCVELNCNNNQLTTLPDLPNCKQLYCSNNLLRELPYLPKAIIIIAINNEFSSIGHINNVIERLYLNNNRKYVLDINKIVELNPSLTDYSASRKSQPPSLFAPKSQPKGAIVRQVPTPYNYYVEKTPMRPKIKDVSLLTDELDVPEVATPLQSMLRSKSQMSEYQDKREERVKNLVKVIKDLFEDYDDVKNENEEVARILLQRTFDKKMTVEGIKSAMKYLSDEDGQRLKKILKMIKEQVDEFEQYKQNPRIGGFSSDQGTISVSHLKRAMRK